MVSLQDSLVSSSARKLPIRVRSDLTVKRQQYLGRTYWIVKDPVGSRYFRFHEEEYAILRMFDGFHSLDEIKEEFEGEFPPQKITLDELQHFLGQLHQSGLIVAATPNQGPELLKRKKKRGRQEIFQKFTNILAVKFKGFDPDPILTFLLPFVRWAFHPVSLFFALFFCLSALTLVLVEFDTFRSKLPAFHQFFGPANLFFLGLTLVLTKALHEFGHGLTAKYFKGECHEMGIMILVLMPCPYVNVSDSWLLPNKWHRIAIAAAGVFVECVLAAVCTFLWWFSQPGLLNYLCLNIVFVSSVSTILFNINPLLRYDGYYIMADWLEIPNLRQKATKILSQKCSEWFLGMEKQEDPFLPQKNQVLFALYSVAAFCYRWVILAGILFFLYKVFEPHGLKILGQMIAAMSLFTLIGMPLYKVVKFFWVPGRIYKVKKGRFYLSLSLFLGLIAFLLFYPLPYTVVAPMIVELRTTKSQHVYVPLVTGGCRLKEINVKPGQFVRHGEKLGVLENMNLYFELIGYGGEVDEDGYHRGGKVKELRQEFETLERLRFRKDEAAFQFMLVQESLATMLEILEKKQKVFDDLILRAPMDGIVVSPAWRPQRELMDDQLPDWWGSPLEPENLGVTLEPGTIFCSVGDPKYLEAVIVVDQTKVAFLRVDQHVELLLSQYPGVFFEGTVYEIEEQPVDALDIQLSTRAGGEVPTMPQRNGTEKPSSASYRVLMLLDNPDLSIKVGMTGIAKIRVEPQTLGMRIRRYISDTFNFKL